ncbi:MAG: AbrB/MazE/SpoVT family DNA-binding domain-containing protein [Terracidiphilus sp.]|jgi:AbrB family looped-hinge helix DNA binding protein
MEQPREEHFAIVSTKGQMVIPAAIRESLGIEPGTRVAIRQEGAEMVLRPETIAAKLSLIEKMHGCTEGDSSGTDMLLEDRRLEREREMREEGW